MTAAGKVMGIVLAGGLSRRMDGREKALLELNGKTLVEQVIQRLKTQLTDVILNANGDPSRFSFLDVPVVADTIDGFAGPLAGVLAGMHHAQESDTAFSHVLSVAADTPFFPENYAARMISALDGETDTDTRIVMASSSGHRHPVFGLWPVSLAGDLYEFLGDEQNRKVMLFAKSYDLREISFEFSGGIDPFFNINTPADLQKAESRFSGTGPASKTA